MNSFDWIMLALAVYGLIGLVSGAVIVVGAVQAGPSVFGSRRAQLVLLVTLALFVLLWPLMWLCVGVYDLVYGGGA